MIPIQVQMFGEFSLSAGDKCISDCNNRSKKVWLLLAYLLIHKDRTIPSDELITLLYGNEPKGANPISSLKTTFHRARTLLDDLWPNAGHELILRDEVGYLWNSECTTILDIDEFDTLCRSTAGDEDVLLEKWMKALSLYHGQFLSKLSDKTWIMTLVAYFNNLVIDTSLKALPLLIARGRLEEGAALCRTALTADPYHEGIHYYLMRILIDQGKQKDAIAVYENLSEYLFSEFGVMPSEEVLALYREATCELNNHTMPMDLILTQLKESESQSGALVCGYDYFVILCRSEARSMLRSGRATHIALISISGNNHAPLSRQVQSHTMDHLEDLIRQSLRRGDTLTRCSVSQFLIMLPQSNYENSRVVCQRIVNAFSKKYPRSPAQITFKVQPLEPTI